MTDGIFSGRGSLRDQSGRGFDRDLRLAGRLFSIFQIASKGRFRRRYEVPYVQEVPDFSGAG